ncbi:MAG: hypothetical protein ACT6R2_04410, partial [Blastomonas fulva]|uniref:hypothetical protein n=1 Tax=Blastomonas fulva TaxID=1550728 RepID=UPI0040335A2C
EALYSKEIIPDWNGHDTDIKPRTGVKFRAFSGISPTLYHRVFSHRPRKDSYGAIAEWVPEQAQPVGAPPDISDLKFEEFVASQVAETVEKIHKVKTAGRGVDDARNTLESSDESGS